MFVARDCAGLPEQLGLEGMLPGDLAYHVSVAIVAGWRDYSMQVVRVVGSADAVQANFRIQLGQEAIRLGTVVHQVTTGATLPPDWPLPFPADEHIEHRYWWPSSTQQGSPVELDWVQQPDPFDPCENYGAQGTAVLKFRAEVYRMDWATQYYYPSAPDGCGG